jgi:hypothetical protein
MLRSVTVPSRPEALSSTTIPSPDVMKLFRDRSNQLGDEFVLRDYLDDVLNTGAIPWSLIRWEMTGLDDEIRELTS